jgi:hypothetical protein
LRQLFGIITALTTAALIIFMAQFIREEMFPYPTGINPDNRSELIVWLEKLPIKAYVIMAVSHLLASFAASFVASLTVGRKRMTLGLLSFSIILVIVTLQSWRLSLPFSFIAIDGAVMILMGFVGALTGSNRYDL